MRIKIGQLKGKEGASLVVKDELSGDFMNEVPEINKVLSPVQVQATVTNIGDGFLVQGKLHLDVIFSCTRCLREFSGSVGTEFEDVYRDSDLQETADDDEDFFPENAPLLLGEEIDITDLIHESLLLAVPMKVVCDESCRGLCPQCGKPLGEGGCDCKQEDYDIRFAPLRDLLKTQERRKENGSTKEETFESKD